MSSQSTTHGTEGVEVSETEQFERNNYFYGKLMTARDMSVEQDYHRSRLHSLSQHVLGSGLVCGLGLTVRTKTMADDTRRLEATVSPGFAVDWMGRPIMVPKKATAEIKPDKKDGNTYPKNNTISVYLNYDECLSEPVPVPSVMNPCEEECCSNRIVEQFTLTFVEDEPETYKRVPEITFPEKGDKSGVLKMAQEYYDQHLADCEPHDDFSLFLGMFSKPDGESESTTWQELSFDRRPFVYTNDMLYAILARHVTDYDNPHDVKFDGVRSVNKATGGEDGIVELVSRNESIDIKPIQQDGETKVNLETKGFDGVRSVNTATGGEDGTVEFVSRNESIDIKPIEEDGETKVNLQTKGFDGLTSINEATGDDGEVELVSESLDIRKVENDDSKVRLEVKPDVDQLKRCVRELISILVELDGLDEEGREKLKSLESKLSDDVEQLKECVTALISVLVERDIVAKDVLKNCSFGVDDE